MVASLLGRAMATTAMVSDDGGDGSGDPGDDDDSQTIPMGLIGIPMGPIGIPI